MSNRKLCLRGHSRAKGNLYGNRCKDCHMLHNKTYVLRNQKRLHTARLKWASQNRDKVNDAAVRHYYIKKAFIWGLKSNPCSDCKQWFHPWQMQFDHLPKFEKGKEINAAWNETEDVLFDELTKCHLVCSNCHEHRSYIRRYENAA